MFSAMLFAKDRVASKTIERVALESQEVCIYKTMHVFPSPYEMTRLLNTFKPDIVFLELNPAEEAFVLARAVRMVCPDAAVIGYQWGTAQRDLEEALEAGVVEILPSPLTEEDLRLCIERAMQKARPELQNNLLAFLPAKAGSGASAVAINVAGSLARDFEQKVLIIDADVHSGLVGVLLKVTSEYNLLHALESASLLDGTLWGCIVSQAHGLDLLPAPKPARAGVASWAQYHQLLQFVRSRYDLVVVDLPEVVNDATIEIVRRAKHVFIVTTPELPALVLARQRCRGLRERGIPKNRIGVIVNRWNKDEIEVADIERFLEEPVAAVFQNDYPRVRRAIQEGRLITRKSDLGKSLATFAEALLGSGEAGRPRSALSFLGNLIPR